jgi:hypothetical protein
MEWEERDSSVPLWKHTIAGATAGIMEHVTLYPVDTVKTHLQASGKKMSFTNTAQILLKEEGFIRFYSGAQVIASGCIPAHAA